MLQKTEICLFCCKSKSLFSEGETFQDAKKKSVEKCLRLLQRHLDTSFVTLKDFNLVFSSHKSSNSHEELFNSDQNEKLLLVECCDSCVEIVDTVSSLIHQMKCIQLKLEWKLGTFLRIMKMGGKVQSRQKVLKSLFNANHKKVENLDDDDTKSGKNRQKQKHFYKRFAKSRREIIQKCSNAAKTKNIYPKLVLIKHEFPNLNANVKVEQTTIEQPLLEENCAIDSRSCSSSDNQFENSNNFKLLDNEYKIISFCLVILMISYKHQENSFLAHHQDDDHHHLQDSDFSLDTNENVEKFSHRTTSEAESTYTTATEGSDLLVSRMDPFSAPDFVGNRDENIFDIDLAQFFSASTQNDVLLKEAKIIKEENVFKGMYHEENCTMVWNADSVGIGSGTMSASKDNIQNLAHANITTDTHLEDRADENFAFDLISEELQSNKRKRTTRNDNVNVHRKRRNNRKLQPTLDDLWK